MKWQHGESWYRIVGDLSSTMTPVVVLHGGPGAAHNYVIAIAEIIAASGRPAILYDQIGCGKSTHLPNAPTDFWRPELFMEELDLLTRHLGISENYSLIGQSWGGMLGMQFATTERPGLKALIVADSPASMGIWSSEATKLRALLPADIEAEFKAAEKSGDYTTPEFLAAMDVYYQRHVCRIPYPQDVLDSFSQIAEDPTVYHTMNGPSEFLCIGTLKSWDIHGDLHKISVPTLLISGAYDEATPGMVQEIHRRIPDVTWELFPESAHMPHVEEPERFSRVVNNFLVAKLG